MHTAFNRVACGWPKKLLDSSWLLREGNVHGEREKYAGVDRVEAQRVGVTERNRNETGRNERLWGSG
jgi:hypothetical protein